MHFSVRWILLLLLPVALCQCTTTRAVVQPQGDEGSRWTRVTQRMAAAVPVDREGRAVAWKFSVRAGAGTNARAWPDGRVQVTQGGLKFVQSDAELAAILAHEMAHVYCRHGRQRIASSLATMLTGAGLAAVLVQSGTDAWAAAGVGSGAALSFSSTIPLARHRDQEFEADAVSLDLMRRADYPAKAAVAFWQRYAKARASHGLGKGGWWKSHPPDAARIIRLRTLAVAP